MVPPKPTQIDTTRTTRLTRSTSVQGASQSVSFHTKQNLRSSGTPTIHISSPAIKKARRSGSLPPKPSKYQHKTCLLGSESMERNINHPNTSLTQKVKTPTKSDLTASKSSTEHSVKDVRPKNGSVQMLTRTPPNSSIKSIPSMIPRPSVRRIRPHLEKKTPTKNPRPHNASGESICVRNSGFQNSGIPTSRPVNHQIQKCVSNENQSGRNPPESLPANNPSLSDRTCSSCVSKEQELSTMIKNFGEIKEKYNREKSLVNQLMVGHNQSVKTISDLETRNAALSARLDALQKRK